MRHGIVVGSDQGNGIHGHADLTVLGWWGGKNYGTGVVSFNGLGVLGGSCCLVAWGGAL